MARKAKQPEMTGGEIDSMVAQADEALAKARGLLTAPSPDAAWAHALSSFANTLLGRVAFELEYGPSLRALRQLELGSPQERAAEALQDLDPEG